MRIKVRALANVIGLVRGDEVYVECGPMVDGLIDGGFLAWIDAPAPTFADYTVTEAVKQRVERKTAEAPGAETVLRVESALAEYLSTWEQDGGDLGADES